MAGSRKVAVRTKAGYRPVEMTDQPAAAGPDTLVVCLPDVPDRVHMGELPANVDVRLVPPEPEPVPDLAEVDLVVPLMRARAPLLELLAGPPGRLRVIQTLSAGVDWLVGHVPEHVTVCNARGVYDAPLAEWVVGAILAMQRGLVQSRDAQARGEWEEIEPPELSRPAGRHPRPRVDRDGDRGPVAAVRRRGDRRGSNRARRRARPGRSRRGPRRRRDPRGHAAADQRDQGTAGRPTAPPAPGRRARGERRPRPHDRDRGARRGAPEPVDSGPPSTSPIRSRSRPIIPSGRCPTSSSRRTWPATPRRPRSGPSQLAGDQIRRFAAGEPLINEVDRYLLE